MLWALAGFWPYVCQELYGPSPNRIAELVTTFGYSVPTGVILGNWSLSFFRGANRELTLLCSCIMVAGIGSLAAITQNTPNLGIGVSFLGGLGIGGIILPSATILTIVSPDEFIATAASLSITSRLVGGSIGYAIYFTVFQNKLSHLLENVGAAVVDAGLPSTEVTAFLSAFSGTNNTALGQYASAVLLAAKEASTDTYVSGFRIVFLVSIAFGGSAVIASLFLGNIKKYMVERVAVDIH